MKKIIFSIVFFLLSFNLFGQSHYGKILRLDANGTQSWEDINSVLTNTQSTTDNPVFWLLNGNTISGSEFIGTKNLVDLVFKTNNAERLRIAATGEITLLNNLFLTNSGSATQLHFYEPIGSGTNYTALQAQTQAGDITYTLPAVAGTNGQVLSTDGTGSLSWITPTGGSTGWSLTGNTGTIPGTNFIGTSDNVDIDIRANNTIRWRFKTKGTLEFLNTAGSVFIGEGAGNSQDMSTIRYNVFVGNQAGYSNTTGNNNTANGYMALYSNTTGSENTANGYLTLYSNTTGYGNTANGNKALSSNTTGNNNTANGYKALYSNTTGISNTANGLQSLFSNTTGVENTANGYEALYNNTEGNNNTANGFHSLYYNTTGYDNTANGYEALFRNITGNNNTANGYLALYFNTTGNNNTANGYRSLSRNTTGNNNVALGYDAGSGDLGVNFNQCTFVGANSYPTTNRTNVTMLGYGITDAQCTGDNQVLLGNTSVTQIRAQVSSITAYSDGRYKTNIENNVHGLDFVMKLKPVTFNVDPRKLHKIWGEPDSVIDKMDVTETMKERRIGFIAQDVEQAAKESGFAFPGIDVPKNDKEAYTLRYVDFIMPMVKSIQEQQTTINQLQSENKELKNQMAILIQEIENIKQEIAKGNLENNNEELFGVETR